MKSQEEDKDFERFYRKILYIAICFSIASMLCFSQIVGSSNTLNKDALLFVGLFCTTITLLITPTTAIMSYIKEPKFVNLEKDIYAYLDHYLAEENRLYYKRIGMEWKMQENFYWLEIILKPTLGDHLDGIKV